jgi:hypothetical protein
MTDTLALEKLFDDVVARFADEATSAVNVFGWREPNRQQVGNRIAWVPGDPFGNAGDDLPPRNPGRNPRPLATLRELFTVVISGADLTTPDNERAQYRATRFLYDAWRRAFYLSAYGMQHGIKSTQWDTNKNERRFGAAMIVVAWIDAMVPDEEMPIAATDATAVLNVTENSLTEIEQVP